MSTNAPLSRKGPETNMDDLRREGFVVIRGQEYLVRDSKLRAFISNLVSMRPNAGNLLFSPGPEASIFTVDESTKEAALSVRDLSDLDFPDDFLHNIGRTLSDALGVGEGCIHMLPLETYVRRKRVRDFTPPHTDFFHLVRCGIVDAGRADDDVPYYTAWIPLHAINVRDHACLQVVPRSHSDARAFSHSRAIAVGMDAPCCQGGPKTSDWVDPVATMDLGDIIVFNCKLLHRSLNTSAGSNLRAHKRHSIDVRFYLR